MTIGERIKQLREKASLSQSELANKAGVSVRSLQNWEIGHRTPQLPAAAALAKALGVKLDELMKGVSE
jgi:transcriptional regulator with XRE-family HTH domain